MGRIVGHGTHTPQCSALASCLLQREELLTVMQYHCKTSAVFDVSLLGSTCMHVLEYGPKLRWRGYSSSSIVQSYAIFSKLIAIFLTMINTCIIGSWSHVAEYEWNNFRQEPIYSDDISAQTKPSEQHLPQYSISETTK